VNRERVNQIWKAEGWQIRTRKRKRRGKGSNENGCAVRRAEHRGHVRTCDFVLDRTEQGGLLMLLPVLDEHTREAHAIEVGRSFTGKDGVEVLLHLFRVHGEPAYIRSDNVPTAESSLVFWQSSPSGSCIAGAGKESCQLSSVKGGPQAPPVKAVQQFIS